MLVQLQRFFSNARPPGSHCTIDADQISLATASAGLRRYGVLKIRGLLNPGAISAVGAAARDLYSEKDARVAAGEYLTAPERRSHLRRTLALDRIVAGGRPAADLLDCPSVRALAGLHLGKPPRLDPNSYVRALMPGPHIQALPFHQDQYILQTPLLNVWIPLAAPARSRAVRFGPGRDRRLHAAGRGLRPVVAGCNCRRGSLKRNRVA